jgi:polyisoprenoid-binding protein YceI
LTIINILLPCLEDAIPSQKEHAMPRTTDHETREQPQTPAPTALSGRWLVDPYASHARFVARTLGGLVKTPGRFGALSGSLLVDQGEATGALVIDCASIDTGNWMRDRHLRSPAFFDVNGHPQLRYEANSITGLDPGTARIDGELVVAGTRTHLPLDLTRRSATAGVLELACQTEVDRVVLGISGARGMVPRTVHLDVAITLRAAKP